MPKHYTAKEAKSMVETEQGYPPNKPSFSWKIWGVVILVLVVLYASFNYYTKSKETQVKPDPIETKLEGYGDAEYEQIKIGMTVSEINEIMGFEGQLTGESTEADVHYESFIWDLNEEANIGGDFENGVLVFKGGWNPRDKYRQEPGPND
jgi:hypothetical protein